MGVYMRGNAITLVVRFETIDPLTGAAVAADPTGVVFTVDSPDDAATVYTFGVDGNVTNPQVGAYVCELAPPLPAGTYVYRVEGSGAVVAAEEGTFDVLESGVLTPTTTGDPQTGPCTPWISGADVANAPGLNVEVGSNDFLLDEAASIGSDVMFELSGRLYAGICQRTVRPCRDACGCWGASSGIGGPWAWQAATWGFGANAGSWVNECGDRCGCGSLPTVRLAGYPVREILAVKIDGATVDAATYRLDGHRDLIRLSDPGPPAAARSWPACQDLTLADTETGTFSVTYRHGIEPPPLGKWAASQLAAELYKAFNGTDGCRLPSNVTRVVRQGVTIEKVTSLANLLRSGQTGLQLVDAFIATANPNRLTRRPIVFSPDLQPFARRAGH
jgi:hypothetical protein